MELDFLKDFEKEVSKDPGITGDNGPPRYWFGSPCHALNRILTGEFDKLLPQGRILGVAGNSGSGKSFLTSNIGAAAQARGAYLLVVDSENALDEEYSTKIGIDTKRNYNYKSVTTIAQATKVVSTFLKGYDKSYGTSPDAPWIVIIIDSLDMLSTDTENENFVKKGEGSADMGQRSKQIKQMLRQFVQGVKNRNISMIVTSQVYANQNLMNGEGLWMVNQAVRYSLSQIILLTKLKLKGDEGISGIRMKCEGFKTRFTMPYQTVTIEVPYETGMDPNSGLLDAAVSLGVVVKKGGWYTLASSGSKFQESGLTDDIVEEIIAAASSTKGFIKSATKDEDLDMEDEEPKVPVEA